ncbi:hypothetical protein D3C81_809270 [compost metagenome]
MGIALADGGGDAGTQLAPVAQRKARARVDIHAVHQRAAAVRIRVDQAAQVAHRVAWRAARAHARVGGIGAHGRHRRDVGAVRVRQIVADGVRRAGQGRAVLVHQFRKQLIEVLAHDFVAAVDEPVIDGDAHILGRLQDQAHGGNLGFFRTQVLVRRRQAAHRRGAIRIEQALAQVRIRRHPGFQQGARHGVGFIAAHRVADAAHLRKDAARARFGQVRRAEAFGIRPAQHQVGPRAPDHAHLGRQVGREMRILVEARRRIDFQGIAERHHHFAKDGGDGAPAVEPGTALLRDQAIGRIRIAGREEAFAHHVGAHGGAHFALAQLEQRAFHLGVPRHQLGPRLDGKGRVGSAQQRRIRLADFAELVGGIVRDIRAAADRVFRERPERLLEALDVDVRRLEQGRMAARHAERRLEIPAAADAAAQADEGAVVFIDILLAEVARRILQQIVQAGRAAHLGRHVGIELAFQVDVVRAQERRGKGVQGIAGVAREPVVRAAAIEAGRAVLAAHLDMGERPFRERFHVAAELQPAAQVGRGALGGRARVELVGQRIPHAARARGFGDAGVAAGRGALGARIVAGLVEDKEGPRVHHARLAAHAHAHVGNEIGIVHIKIRGTLLVRIGQGDAVALVDIHGSVDVVAVAGQVAQAIQQAGLALAIGFHAGRKLAVGARFQPLVRLLGDDVDHARHGVGAIHGRRAIREDFHALDGGGGNRVDIDEHGLEAGRGTIERQAAAVEQHQGALRAHAAQIGLRAAIGTRKHRAEILLRRAGGWQVVEHLQQGERAHVLDLLGVDHLHRRRRFRVDALQAGACHLDPRQLLLLRRQRR